MSHRRPIFSSASVFTACVVGFLLLEIPPYLSWVGHDGLGSLVVLFVLLASGILLGEGLAVISFMRFERYPPLTFAAFVLNVGPLVYCICGGLQHIIHHA